MNHHACGATWTGHIACHCATCHQTFTGLTTFDQHRTSGGCTEPGSIRRKDGNPALALNKRGQWTTWLTPAEIEANRERVASLKAAKSTSGNDLGATNSPTPVPDSQPTPQRPPEATTRQETR